ncbi:SusC/RagA family TonB-linked outer membrane protein [Cyclobacterium xiamenense]|uniref:SusC/RagA family TonB-linked outer membrane protein n=1 Tax=Cyclobacterium xiamenense TaxID=1297121 RepID=UPI00138728B9|nr:TonB-dependent receptor [Cyclobacterium xiamenense]
MKKCLLKHVIYMTKLFTLAFTLQCLSMSLLLAWNGNAQVKSIEEVPVHLSLTEVKVEEAFKELERITEFNFVYASREVRDSPLVSVTSEGESLYELLLSISSQSDLRFKQVDGNIHVKKSDEEAVVPLVLLAASTVSGKVTDENGEPLPGATVTVLGTTSGTVSDLDGNYSLTVEEGATLVFSYIGYVAQRITVGNQTTIDISLAPDASALEEVVVVGYGEVKKSDLTGAVGSVNSEDIIRQNPVQAAKALQGQVAGVNVNKINSRPGADYTIDIRGLQSIGFSNEPLVVIDGVMGGRLNTLNPSDIASMDVLKDASSSAIYGARGANGVIIITTKKGVQGKTKVTYEGYAGVKTPAFLPDLMNAQEFYTAYNDVVLAENPNAQVIWTTAQLENVQNGRSVNWVDQVTDPSLQTSHVIALSGGNENTTHYFSAGYLNEKGNVLHTGFERFNLKGSADSKLNEVVKVGFNTYYTYSILNTGSFETLRNAYRARPTGTIYYDDLTNPTETNDKNVDGYAFWMGIKDTQVNNPLTEVAAKNFQDETRVSSFLGNAYVELTPFEGLSFRSSMSASVFNSRRGEFRGSDSKSRLNRLPSAGNDFTFNGSYTWDNILNYKLKTGMHDFNFTAVQSALQERFETSRIRVENLAYNSSFYALNTAAQINGVASDLVERSILSYMGRFNYIFNEKYLFTLTGRYDGSSVLAEGNQWAFFPSAAIAYRIGDEAFIQNMNLFSDLKIRLSYGRVGNDVVAPYSTQAYLNRTAYDFDGNPAFGYAPRNIGNSELRWENSEEFNLGINMGFLENRINAEVELYSKETNDLIQNVAIPTSLGFGAVTSNVGKLLNRGIEVTVNSVNVQTQHFRWNTTINFSSNHNEILELYGGTVQADIANRLFVGHSLRSNYYYEFDGIWQLDEAEEALAYGQVPGSVKVVDQNNDGLISSSEGIDDRVILGNQLPKWMAGFNNMFTYKEWDLSVFVYTRQGVQFRNSLLQGTMGDLTSNRYNRLNLNYWTENNPTNDYYGVWQNNPFREAIQYKDASFWRISNVTLGYTFPATVLNSIKFSNLRLYGQANNLFVFTREKNTWMDPEFNSGTYQDDVPHSIFQFGVSASF